MTTTRFTLLAAVALAGILAACSTTATVDTTPPTTTSVSASTELATTEATTSESVTDAPATSPTSEASATVEVPPTTEVPSTTEAPPTTETSPVGGFGLAGQDLADAQAAWDAYQAFRAFYVQAGENPAGDWSGQLATFTEDPARTNLRTALSNYAKLQSKVDDRTQAEITKIDVEPDFIIFSVCVDATATKFFDKDGIDITAPDAPGSYKRHPGELWMERQSGAWLFVDSKNDFQTQC